MEGHSQLEQEFSQVMHENQGLVIEPYHKGLNLIFI